MGLTYATAFNCKALLHSTLAVDLAKGPLCSNSVSFKYRDFVIGSFVSFDNTKAMIDSHSFAIGVDYPNYKATLHAINGGSSIMTTLYQKFPSGTEVGCKVTHAKALSSSLLEFGCRIPVEKQAFLKAKMDHTGKAALSYTSRLSQRVSLTLAAAFDSLAPNDLSSRKLGCSLNVEM
ncbi:hypothetical protein DI09_46p170 [Mitosporidium daphniae]|uniref:Uncharacterized protein n=1 Tax=Mitosporidium daphniae TaxID=1485682 RepID=A0A098VPT4_9MICR|nr:uncharacterized protein DI09_46p170 [Mitosporidium daphniae]KGG51067.1 hypothetical protein DI09_46p170 [Mitosporidium daphniae]|eukprot:XP_013237494.1 uncharacterized protein DI09_46p170 [Mitosporidium daphniae]